MKQDYVVCRGKKYNSGDTINILWYAHGNRNAYEHTGIFLDCDEEKDEYRLVIDDITYSFNKTSFYRTVYDKRNVTQHKNSTQCNTTFKDELNIDGLFIAWVWYVFIMLLAIIFKDCIAIWIITSVIFFRYRNKKLREAGYKK